MRVRRLKSVKPAQWVVLLGLAFGAVAGCGDDESKTFDACTVGDTRECLGPGACKGAQACKADRSGFEPCSCESDGGGGDGNGPTPGDAGTNAGGTSAGSTSAGGTSGTDAGGTAGSGETPGGGGGPSEGGAAGAGGTAPALDCHPIGNVGCGANQNCSIDGGVDPVCVTAGNKTVLAKCTATSECAPGLSCHLNNCLKVCGELEDCDSDNVSIKCGLGFTREPLGLIGSCVTGCDVLAQDCPAGQACYLGSCLTPTLNRANDEECGFATDCAKGLDCLVDLDGDTASDCSKYCSTTAQNPCGTGYTCYGLSEAFPSLPDTWGICIEGAP